MPRNMQNYKMTTRCVLEMKERGVTIQDIAEIVMLLQKKYIPNLTFDECEAAVLKVLEKNEVQHAIMTGIAIDKLTEQKVLPIPEAQTMIENDEPLYGVDEVLAYGICNLYGSIALTNFGYVDKLKPGIIEKLNSHDGVNCHTFLDDIVGAIAASAASRIAHAGKRIDID